jgi:hypothetical protein
MAGNALDADNVFEMLRDHSQHNRQARRRGCGDRRQPPPAGAANTAAVG